MVLRNRIGSGGEGVVYDGPTRSGLVAKVYSQPVDRQLARKLKCMVGMRTDALGAVCAWPTGTIHASSGGRVLGFLMPKVQNSRPLHEVYSPADRKRHSPNIDWAFLIQVARNLAAAFDTVHVLGKTVGDVNQRNILVLPNALVKLIDCDSFQLRIRGSRFPCSVFTPEFAPPELQGVVPAMVEFTTNHDNFGLAVLIFHLLFMGRHPFAGRYAGDEQMVPELAIRQLRFAHGPKAASKLMAPPPYSLPFECLTDETQRLFCRAFGGSDARGAIRPPGIEWMGALDRLRDSLDTCAANHRYPQAVARCPWCEIEASGGPSFFRPRGSFPLTFSAARYVQAVEAIPRPISTPEIALPQYPPTAAAPPLDFSSERRKVLVLVGVVVGFGILGVPWQVVVLFLGLTVAKAVTSSFGREAWRRYVAYLMARRRFARMLSDCCRQADERRGIFAGKRQEALAKVGEYESRILQIESVHDNGNAGALRGRLVQELEQRLAELQRLSVAPMPSANALQQCADQMAQARADVVGLIHTRW